MNKFKHRLNELLIITGRQNNPVQRNFRARIIMKSTLFFFLFLGVERPPFSYPSTKNASTLFVFSNFRVLYRVFCRSRLRTSLGIHKAICMGPALAT